MKSAGSLVANKMSKAKELSQSRQYLSSAIASFGCVCAGTVLAWTSPVLPQLLEGTDFKVSTGDGGMVGSIVAIGAMASALPAGYAAEKFGTRSTLSYLSIPFIIGWILIGFVEDLKVLYLARFLGGFASGAICVCVPMYVGEIASVSIRGTLGSFFQMSFCAGILLVNIIGASMHWRQLSWVLAVFPAIYFFALFLIPDTKRHDEDDDNGEKEVLKPVEKIGVWNLLKNKRNLKALRVSLGLVSFQQFSGVNAVIFYTSGIFAATGSSLSPGVSSVIVAGIQLVFACTSAAIIERFNRKFYLLISALGMCGSLLLLGMYFHLKLTFSGVEYVPIVALAFFIISYSAGYGPIPWLMLGEIFAPEFKGVGCGCATMWNWSLVFLVTGVFPTICSYLGEHYTFYLFAMLNLVAAFFTVYFVPETRGKTSKEIQDCL